MWAIAGRVLAVSAVVTLPSAWLFVPAAPAGAKIVQTCEPAPRARHLETVFTSPGAVTTGAGTTGPSTACRSDQVPPTPRPTPVAVRRCATLSAALPGVAEGIPGGDPFAARLSAAEVAARRVAGGQLVVGGIYLRYCSEDGAAWALVGTFTFRGGGDPAPAPAPEAADVARLALARIALPPPLPFTAPPRDTAGLVGIATWLWVDPAQWHPLEATAAVPGLAVTATVTPVRTRWDMGEGRGKPAEVCDGPGTPYDPRTADRLQATSCSYVFQWASDDHRHELPGADGDDLYHASAAITWAVRWTDSLGGAGTLPDMTTTTPFDLRIGEIQAVVCYDTPLGACRG